MDIDALLARQLRALRRARALTLEQLAERSGVSRSMISLIERQQTSPSAAVLHRLAGALGVPMSALFAETARDAEALPLARRAEQPVWRDPDSGYERRQLSPTALPVPLDLVEVGFPAGQRVTFEPDASGVLAHQQLWLLEGEMEITVGERAWRLRAGDCLAMAPGPRIVFANPTRRPARYLLARTLAGAHFRSP